MPLGGGNDVRPGQAKTLGTQRVDESVDRCVVAHWIMMGERELSHLRKSGDGTRVLDGAVAPADLLWVFAGPVLRVVHDQVGARKKLGVAAIFPQEIADAGSKRM